MAQAKLEVDMKFFYSFGILKLINKGFLLV